jgi:hypothetical protein
MKLKTVEVDGKTYAEVQDGKPVYEDTDGKVVAFDAPGTRDTITRLNAEAKGHREAKEAAESKLRAFEGITDPVAAKKALETVTSIDQKKLIDAGEVDKVRNEISQSFQAKLDAAEKRAADLEGSLYSEKIGGAFARSKFIADKVAIPADFVQAKFGAAFKIEDGKVVAYGQDGNRIYSRARPGEVPDFDEALEILVDSHPTRDAILKGDIKGGGGAGQSQGGGAGRTMKQSAFDALPAKERAARMTETGFAVVPD